MHNLIIGRTGCGKSTLAKQKAKIFKKKFRRRVAVLTAVPDSKDWCCDVYFNSPKKFVQFVFSHTNYILFIDEGGTTIGRYNYEMEKVATMGRHYGHLAYFIAQRAKQISLTVRCQCSNVFVFKSSASDIKDIDNEFVCKGELFKNVENLKKFEYLYALDDSPVKKGKVSIC
jgi:energy-coupling factor transporter ATP-binding protein EcfA2